MPRGVNRLDMAILHGRLWTPDQLRAKNALAAWWHARDYTVSGVNGLWPDRSGNGRNGTKYDTSTPALFVNGWGGDRPGVGYNGTTQSYLGLTNAITYDVAAGMTIFAAASMTSDSHPQTICGGVSSSPQFRFDGNNAKIQLVNTGVYNMAELALPYTVGRYIVGVDFLLSATYLGFSINGLYSQITMLNSSAFANPITGIVGNPNNGFEQLMGMAGEIIICSRMLSVADRQKLEGYLAWGWDLVANLPASHPYKNNPPLIGV